MSLSAVSFNLTFDFSSSPKVFIIEDTTDYAGAAVSKTVANGVLTITGPDGSTIYNNTNFNDPDIDCDVSLTNSAIQLPLMGDGSVMQGSYTVTYTVRIAGASIASAYEVSDSKTYSLNYLSGVNVSLSLTMNCNKPLLTSTDTTDYTYLGVTPTITRDHRIQYPQVANTAEIQGGNATTVTTSTVYVVKNTPLTYTSTVSSTLIYSMGGGVYIKNLVSGATAAQIACDPNLCDIYCGLHAAWDRYINYKGTQRGADELNKIVKMTSVAQLAAQAIECGKSDDVPAYLAEIKAIGGFDDDCGCGCDDSAPTLVQGLGGGTANIVVEAGNGISVTSTTAGGQTTYTVALSTTLLNKINAMSPIAFAEGTGIDITSSTASDGTITYTITNSAATDNPDLMAVNVGITFNGKSSTVPTLSVVSSKIYGDLFNAPTLANDNGGSYNDWASLPVAFTLSNIFSGSATSYYPTIEVVESTILGASSTKANDGQRLTARIIDFNTSDIKFTLQTPDGSGYAQSGAVFDGGFLSATIIVKFMA
jgi:hypothetical protein